MIDPSPGVPPHIALLLNEDFDLSDYAKTKKKLRELFPDLVNQARICPHNNVISIESKPTDFTVVLSGGLDLFRGDGACQNLTCRISYADQISRSVALIADKVAMLDNFSTQIISAGKRPKREDLDRILLDLVILKRLGPLVGAGLLKFISPTLAVCSGCLSEFDRRVDSISNELSKKYSDRIMVDRSRDYVFIDSSPLFDPPFDVILSNSFSSGKSDFDISEYVIRQCVRGALWDARNAGMAGGALFSNSRCGIDALMHGDGRVISRGDFRIFEGQRAASLPWVKGLTVDQVIELREEAGAALPPLREFMARRLSPGVTGDLGNSDDWIAELREQAAEVESVLHAITSKKSSFGRNAKGVVGMVISAVGFAAEGGVQALGSLLDTLGLVHDSQGDDSPHVSQLKAKPGYVLVAAKDILAHADPRL
jgi:hypothetical protein